MTTHQIIHTSCKKGIFNRSSGFQIYSFDKGYESYLSKMNSGNVEMPPEVAEVSTYKEPDGIFATDEITAQEMPKTFSYRRISNGQCVIAKSIYCRDYTSPTARFGNRFRHHVIYDVTDASFYPCDMYDSNTLRETLTTEEVGSNDAPDYLPAPTLQKGSMINEGSISEFLNEEDDRSEIFKMMLYALLHYKSDNKKIIICDDEKNIVFWIAALEYAVPLKLAVDISFTTYTYNPLTAPFMICGVYPPNVKNGITRKTEYDYNDPKQRNECIIFDLKNNIIPDDADFELNSFYDFVELMLLSDSYPAIKAFHDFVDKNYPNVDLTEKYSYIYCMYDLYNNGITSMKYSTFRGVVEYLKSVGNDRKEVLKVADILLRDFDKLMSVDQAFLADALGILYSAYPDFSDEKKHALESYVVDRTLKSFINKGITESDFLAEYEFLEKISDPHVSIKSILMEKDGLQKIMASLSSDRFPLWKLQFINKIIFDKYQNADLSLYQSRGIISSLYLKMLNSCNEPAKFSENVFTTYSRVADKLLALLFTFHDNFQGKDADDFFAHATEIIAKNCYSSRSIFFKELLNRKMYSQMYQLYIAFLDNNPKIESMKTLFNEQSEIYLKNNAEYKELFFNEIIRDFTSRVERVNDTSSNDLKKTLLLISLRNNIPVSNDNIRKTAALIPLSELSKDDEELVFCLRDHYQNSNTTMDPYVKLLVTGSMIHNSKDLVSIISVVNNLYPEKKISFNGTVSKYAEDFIIWITCDIAGHCKSKDDIAKAFSLFNLSKHDDELTYVKEFARCCINCSDKSRDNTILINYLEYIAESPSKTRRDAVKSVIKSKNGMSKSAMNTLGNTINTKYSNKAALQEYWREINKISISPSTNNVSGTLSSFFDKLASFFRKN